MKFIKKLLDLINDKVLIILLEICLMLNNIKLNNPLMTLLWLICVTLNIFVLACEDEKKE